MHWHSHSWTWRCHGLGVQHGCRGGETGAIKTPSEGAIKIELSSDEDLNVEAPVRVGKNRVNPWWFTKRQKGENTKDLSQESCPGDWHIGSTRNRDKEAHHLSRPELPHMTNEVVHLTFSSNLIHASHSWRNTFSSLPLSPVAQYHPALTNRSWGSPELIGYH